MRVKKKIFKILIILGLFLSFSPHKSTAQNDSSNVKKIHFSIYPAFGYQPETNFSFGAIGFIVYKNATQASDEHYRPSNISPYFLYTLNNQMLIAIDFDLYFKNGYNLEFKPRYYNYPDFFYGIGNDNIMEDEETYTNVYAQIDGRLMKFLDKKWSVGLRFDFQHNKIYDLSENGQLINSDIPGRQGGTNMGIGPAAQFDSRNNILYPTNGSFVRTEINFYSKALGGDFNYSLFTLDLRKFISIKNEKNILAFQAAGNFTSGDEVPFYKLQKVGGDSRLRGIENANLYLDKQSFWMQAEYRRDLFWRFGGVAFAGFGDVAPKLSNYRFDELKYVVGLGGRFQALKDEKLNLRLDAGIGRGGQYAFYISIKEAF